MDVTPSVTFGKLLRQYRRSAGLTQEELADRARVSPRAISDLERGQRNRPWRDTVQLLATALRLEPSDRARLEAAARQRHAPFSAAILVDDPHPDVSTSRHNLPAQVTSFVGRERELSEIQQLLRDQNSPIRLITLTGAGGSGKTRLALQVAAGIVDQFADGVWLVELAPLTDALLVAQTVAQTLGIRESPNIPLLETLAERLRSKTLLLILDNCEHLIVAGAQLVDQVIRNCPHVRILTTSHEPLRVAGETVRLVHPLPSPDLQAAPADPRDVVSYIRSYESIQLFVDRARLVVPGFDVTSGNAVVLVQICRQLDGIPLALELAAARLSVLTVEQIATRLNDRFRLLTSRSRTVPRRQQTLRSLIDWSYELLTEPERTLLRRLGAFVGSFTLDTAEVFTGKVAVGDQDGDVLSVLVQLVEKSLVVVEPGDHGMNRFRLLDTVRQYAREKLVAYGELEAISLTHAYTYLDLAEEAEPELRGPRQAVWLERIDREQSDLRAAMDWFTAGGFRDEGLRLAGAMSWFWTVRGIYTEGRSRLTKMLASGGAESPNPAVAKAYDGLAGIATRQGDLPEAVRYREACLSAATEVGDKRLIVRALTGLPGDSSSPGQVRAHLREALEIAREAGLPAEVGRVLVQVAIETYQFGHLASASSLLAEALPILREAGDAWSIMFGLRLQFTLDEARGDYARARAVAEESQTIARTLGDASGKANSLMLLGEVAVAERDLETAYPLLAEARTIYQDIGDQTGVCWADADLGDLYLRRGELEAARVHVEEGLALARPSGWNEFMLMSLHVAADVALSEGEIGIAASYLREGLVLIADRPEAWGPIYLEGMARVAGAQGAPIRALRLASAAAADRVMRGMKSRPLDRDRLAEALQSAQLSLAEMVRSAAWAEGQAMTLGQAVNYALSQESI